LCAQQSFAEIVVFMILLDLLHPEMTSPSKWPSLYAFGVFKT
jgi:hypothetical protein